jgi:hypothetical protein
MKAKKKEKKKLSRSDLELTIINQKKKIEYLIKHINSLETRVPKYEDLLSKVNRLKHQVSVRNEKIEKTTIVASLRNRVAHLEDRLRPDFCKKLSRNSKDE